MTVGKSEGPETSVSSLEGVLVQLIAASGWKWCSSSLIRFYLSLERTGVKINVNATGVASGSAGMSWSMASQIVQLHRIHKYLEV